MDRLASATTSGSVGADVLVMHRSSQRFRNPVNIEAQVRESALGNGAAPRVGASLVSLGDDLRRQADALAAAVQVVGLLHARLPGSGPGSAEDVDRTRRWVGGEVTVSLVLACRRHASSLP
ncbi:hypothetical protein [Paraburkholderia sp. DGU8]|uniref:hypothetical protein n=1 Tax=Paraburkholderia sp. DGU8 TaxID=3161997 RepID=UPI00346541D5